MTRGGRPLRFAALVLTGWIGLRVAMLWPHATALPVSKHPATGTFVAGGALTPQFDILRPAATPERMTAVSTRPSARSSPQPDMAAISTFAYSLPQRAPDALALQFGLVSMVRFAGPMTMAKPSPSLHPLAARSGDSDLWHGTAWLMLRDRGVTATAPGGGQLGGSQVGARVSRQLSPTLDAAARVSAPIADQPGSDAGMFVEWRPWQAPVRVSVGGRIGLDGHPGGPEASVIAGSGPSPIAPGVELESYAQAGAVLRNRADYYADGAARITHPVATGHDSRLSLGVGAWGGVQRDVARVDVGPSASVTLPVNDRSARLSLEWRQRVAGDAAPDSGPALTIGMNF